MGGVKCVLLYKLPKGVLPAREDIDRLVTALTQQLYCVPEASARPGSQGGAERAVEASISIFKQLLAPDPSLIKEPKSLQDVRLYKLHREAPHKAFLLLKHVPPEHPTHVTEAEPSLRTFLEKRLDYRQRVNIHIQSQAWLMGDKASDVTIKLLSVLQQGSQAPRLLALEVTYHPAAMLSAATPLLQELAEHIISAVGPPTGSGPGQAGTLVLLQPRHYQPTSSDPTERSVLYGPMHVVELYNNLLEEGLLGRQQQPAAAAAEQAAQQQRLRAA